MADKNVTPDPKMSPASPKPEEPTDFSAILEDIEELPVEAKKVIQTFGMMGVGHFSQENAIAKKINEEHITNYLDGAKLQMQNEYKERHERKIFVVFLVALALSFIIGIIFLLKDQPAILEKIIYSVAGLVAGAFGGYGFGKHSGRDDD